MRWYVSRNGTMTPDPVSEEQVRSWVAAGMTDAQIRDEFGGNWVPVLKSPFANCAPTHLRPLTPARRLGAAVGLGLAAGVAGLVWLGPFAGLVAAVLGAVVGLVVGNARL